MKPSLRLALALLIPAGAAAAPEFTSHRSWAHVNGYTHHFAATDANNALLGVGFTRYTRTFGRVLPAWETDIFRDSGAKLSAYVGYSLTVPTRFVSFGATGAVMYHRNFRSQNQLRVMPVAFPFLETRGDRLKVRIYYVPPVRRASDEQIALQVMLPWAH